MGLLWVGARSILASFASHETSFVAQIDTQFFIMPWLELCFLNLNFVCKSALIDRFHTCKKVLMFCSRIWAELFFFSFNCVHDRWPLSSWSILEVLILNYDTFSWELFRIFAKTLANTLLSCNISLVLALQAAITSCSLSTWLIFLITEVCTFYLSHLSENLNLILGLFAF